MRVSAVLAYKSYDVLNSGWGVVTVRWDMSSLPFQERDWERDVVSSSDGLSQTAHLRCVLPHRFSANIETAPSLRHEQVVKWAFMVGGGERRSHVTYATCACQRVPKQVANKLVRQYHRVRVRPAVNPRFVFNPNPQGYSQALPSLVIAAISILFGCSGSRLKGMTGKDFISSSDQIALHSFLRALLGKVFHPNL